ncbi:MAG: NAD-dependent epimerase/dehydratase family protein [Spirochaetales bacterium]|nr:NAD-dependent epimerase/dehydratase family protein [Spirochaetales bacterium]
MDKVMITGATGFIGSHIVREFLRHDVPVGCLVRKQSDTTNIDGLDLEIRYGDIRDLSSLEKAFTGYGAVIHAAAFVRDWGEYALFRDINIGGTLNVLAACLANNIRKVIMTGSCASYGEENSQTVKTESDPFNPHYPYFLDGLFPSGMNHYRDTKALATREAAAFARKGGMNLTILEPVWVFGEREYSTGFFEYLTSIREGLFAVPGSRINRFHVIYAPDCARAYWCAYNNQPPGVHRILVGNRKAEKMNRIFSTFVKYAGFKSPLLLPKWAAYPVALAIELFHIVFKRENPPFLSRARVNMFYDNIEYSVKKAEDLLGFRAEIPLEKAIAKTVSWYKRNDFL